MRKKVRKSMKFTKFSKHISISYYSTEKINFVDVLKKTNDDSEYGALLSQIAMRCPLLL